MYQAPMQDNNRPQHHNHKHPANVANRVALVRVKSQFHPQMQAANPGAIARAHESNRLHPNTTFFTPRQSRQAHRMARRNDPLGVLGNKVEGFLGLKETAHQAAQMFDPRSRAGLLNLASMFVGGPKGDASPMMGKLGMPGQFRDYGGAPINPLARGLTHEGAGGTKGAGIRGLVRRSQGVGGYRRANPLDVIEGKHIERSHKREASDMAKGYINLKGFQAKQRENAVMRASKGRTDNLMKLDEIMGMRSVPYSFRDAVKQENRQDLIPQTGAGLDNFVKYLAHYMDKGHSFHEGSMKAMWDYLFGGEMHQFPGTGPFPKKP